MKKYQVSVNGKQYVVEVEELAEGAQPVATGRQQEQNGVQPRPAAPQTAAREVAQGTAEGIEVKAPLSGQIMRILVKPGDEVTRGQVLLTIEALKLENEIVSPVDGVVTGVFTEQGAVADTGTVLVTVKERED